MDEITLHEMFKVCDIVYQYNLVLKRLEFDLGQKKRASFSFNFTILSWAITKNALHFYIRTHLHVEKYREVDTVCRLPASRPKRLLEMGTSTY